MVGNVGRGVRPSNRIRRSARWRYFLTVATAQEERDAALAAYRVACAEFDHAQQLWDPFLAVVDTDPAEADAAFERLRQANQARQDALDTLWVAWRNRADPS